MSFFRPLSRESVSPVVSPRSTSTSYASRLPLRMISSVSWVRELERRVVWALSWESNAWVWMDSSGKGTELPLIGRVVDRERDGRVEFR
jgi:hypothetical protein